MPAVVQYRRAVAAVLADLPPFYASVVCTSITSAVQGHFGDHHATRRTAGSKLFINPLMSLYWCFQLSGVAAQMLYREPARNTETMEQMAQVISDFRTHCTSIRPRREIPV